MSFQHGLSGLSVASTNLDVVGNNVANANTIGYKQSQAQFTDIYANSLAGAGHSEVGIGSKVAAIAQAFNQGDISPTSNPLDIAINGQGFFRMSDQGVISYSRNGQFQIDKNGFIVDSKGTNLTGYATDANQNIVSNQPTNLKITTSDLPPKVTSTFEWGFNLDSRKSGPSITTFNANNAKSYTNTSSGTVIDSLGNPHTLAIFFQKSSSTPNEWQAYATIDGKVDAAGLPVGVTLDSAGSKPMTFNEKGIMTAPTGSINVSVDLNAINPTLGAESPFDFTLDLTKTTQFGSDFGINSITQNGYTSGRLSSFQASVDGIIQGIYTNGQTRTLGQVVLASFVNPHGLNPVGDGRWLETPESGQPLVGIPKTGTLGVLQPSAVEDANVDLTAELVKMITAQRMYQANAKTIETQDAILQTLVNL